MAGSSARPAAWSAPTYWPYSSAKSRRLARPSPDTAPATPAGSTRPSRKSSMVARRARPSPGVPATGAKYQGRRVARAPTRRATSRSSASRLRGMPAACPASRAASRYSVTTSTLAQAPRRWARAPTRCARRSAEPTTTVTGCSGSLDWAAMTSVAKAASSSRNLPRAR